VVRFIFFDSLRSGCVSAGWCGLCVSYCSFGGHAGCAWLFACMFSFLLFAGLCQFPPYSQQGVGLSLFLL
jgi:predicted branched-subunit amino acid permease